MFHQSTEHGQRECAFSFCSMRAIILVMVDSWHLFFLRRISILLSHWVANAGCLSILVCRQQMLSLCSSSWKVALINIDIISIHGLLGLGIYLPK